MYSIKYLVDKIKWNYFAVLPISALYWGMGAASTLTIVVRDAQTGTPKYLVSCYPQLSLPKTPHRLWVTTHCLFLFPWPQQILFESQYVFILVVNWLNTKVCANKTLNVRVTWTPNVRVTWWTPKLSSTQNGTNLSSSSWVSAVKCLFLIQMSHQTKTVKK